LNPFQKWALATTIATFVLIMIGGIVRASDSGLGCPDWPQCFGRPYPPLTESQVPDHIDAGQFDFQAAWIEYVNRLVGVLIGFLILGTMYHALKTHRRVPRVLYPTIAAFVLVLFQGWLGGEVVESELNPLHITAHLVLALLIVNLLLYATVSAFFPETRPYANLPRQRRTLGRLALLVLVLVLVQVGFGAGLRGELEIVEDESPTLARGEWIEEAGWVDPVHRSFSWLVLAGVVGLVYYTHRRMQEQHHLIQWAARAAGGLVIVQILAGIGLAYGPLPPILQVTHLVGASLLVGALMALYLLASRIPTETSSLESSLQQQLLSRHAA
jgi:cytochrome c oxidase assembly protein subunit 15